MLVRWYIPVRKEKSMLLVWKSDCWAPVLARLRLLILHSAESTLLWTGEISTPFNLSSFTLAHIWAFSELFHFCNLTENYLDLKKNNSLVRWTGWHGSVMDTAMDTGKQVRKEWDCEFHQLNWLKVPQECQLRGFLHLQK